MQFKLFTVATAFLTAGSVYAAPQLGATDVVTDLTQLTQSATNTNGVLQQLTLLNSILQGPLAIAGLTGILAQVTAFDSALNLGSGALPTPSTVDQTQICNAVSTFLNTYQGLITTVQSKTGVLNGLGLGPIVGQVLATGLVTINGFIVSIIAQVPTCGAGSTTQLGGVQALVATVIKTLGGTVPALPGLPGLPTV